MRSVSLTVLLALLLLLPTACGGKDAPPADAGNGAAKMPAPAGPDLLAKALKKAGETDMNVLVEYYDETCQFCTQMDREVYTDEDIKALLGNLVYLRLERGKTGKPFEERWGDLPTPTFAVLKADGSQVGELKTGFIDVDGMFDFVDWAAMAEGDMPEISTGGS